MLPRMRAGVGEGPDSIAFDLNHCRIIGGQGPQVPPQSPDYWNPWIRTTSWLAFPYENTTLRLSRVQSAPKIVPVRKLVNGLAARPSLRDPQIVLGA